MRNQNIKTNKRKKKKMCYFSQDFSGGASNRLS